MQFVTKKYSKNIRSTNPNVHLSSIGEIAALKQALTSKCMVTDEHSKRIKKSMHLFIEKLDIKGEDHLLDYILFARFHDIGKTRIPSSLLLKKGPLSEEEWKVMRTHCKFGYDIAREITELEGIAEWILLHHERWDGNGYPIGVKGEDIPMPCRILAIVDAYDAMTHDRPYRKKISESEAVSELKRCSGTQFDPNILEIFLNEIL